jgi:hypothetical protein
MSASAPPNLDQVEQLAKIVQALTDTTRKQQEIRFAPWLAACSGMTAGAALFAAGIAFARVFMGAPT